MDFILIAHPAHWAIWFLYSAPVLIVLGASAKALRDQRREDRAEKQRQRASARQQRYAEDRPESEKRQPDSAPR